MIRFLLYFSALLVLINVTIYVWPVNVNSAPHIYSPESDLNPHFVRLNKEIEERFYSSSTEEIAGSSIDGLDNDVLVDSGAAVDSGSDEELIVASSSVIEGVDGALDCYRVGPFMHQANYELAQAVLFNADVDYKKSKRASRESDVFRIFLGPFESQVEVRAARLELTKKKVLDHFVRKRADGLLVISLGIYSTNDTANAAVRLFEEKLGEVQRREETIVLPDSYWLHFGATDDDRSLAQLSNIDWGEPSAKMGLYGCNL